ncbi:extracellular solute-binding protein [Nocardiopsis sp. CNR-923]|uniref:extracellular solute-binding protein n=1 Tax=Nocardiopsis sp. CNR-923 TaxID=1904965 RepID=UPI00117D778C
MKFPKIAAATAAVLLAAACSAASDGADGDGGAGDAPRTLTVWRMGDATEAQTAFVDTVTAQYQEQYPDTGVEVQWIPWGEFSQRFQTALVSGGPDVVEIGNDQVSTWTDAGALYDVAELAELGGPRGHPQRVECRRTAGRERPDGPRSLRRRVRGRSTRGRPCHRAASGPAPASHLELGSSAARHPSPARWDRPRACPRKPVGEVFLSCSTPGADSPVGSRCPIRPSNHGIITACAFQPGSTTRYARPQNSLSPVRGR